MQVQVLYFDGCPNWAAALDMVTGVASSRGFEVTATKVESAEHAAQIRFRGSPTILVDGRDPFEGGGETGLSCRLYQTPDGPAGMPTLEQIERALDG